MSSNGRSEPMLEAYIDGELDPDEAAYLERMVASDPDLLDEMQTALFIREELQALPRPECPTIVTRSVLSVARKEARAAVGGEVKRRLREYWSAYLQPSLAVAGLVAVIVTASLMGSPPSSTSEENVAVNEALEEAKWTLAYLSEVGVRTGQTVRHDVIESKVVRPMHQALDSALNN